jgi:hypothetical protein
MCGPSGQEEALASQEGSLSTALMNAFNERLGTQTNILSQVQNSLGQLRSGNFPPGYSPSVMSALQTRALSEVAGATRSAQQVAANAFAGRGGGASSPLESGIQQQITGEIASSGAAKQADLLNKLDIDSFDLGRQNLIASISGLQTLAGAEDPLGFAGGASSANASAFGQAKTINQQKNQMWADIAGGITGVAKTALGFIPGGGIASKIIGSGMKGLGAGSLNPTGMQFGPSAPLGEGAPDITSQAGLDVVGGMDFGNSSGLSDNVG